MLQCFKLPAPILVCKDVLYSLLHIFFGALDFEPAVINFSLTSASPYSNKTTRALGYMHYDNWIIGERYSIYCYVDEWYNFGKTVTVMGAFGSVIQCATWLAGALGLPAAIATGIVNSLIYAAVLVFVEQILTALFKTEVTANVTEQRIYGNCTSHIGKPKGDLGDARIVYVTSTDSRYTGQYFYEGFTSQDWGTGALGSRMFWQVFGVEYTPTSWTYF